MDININFINERKKALGLTNQMIAEKTGITLSTLDKITSGANTNPKLSTMRAISRVLNCKLDDFDAAEPAFSSVELDLVEKYRALDLPGQSLVRLVVDHETERVRQGNGHVGPSVREALGEPSESPAARPDLAQGE